MDSRGAAVSDDEPTEFDGVPLNDEGVNEGVDLPQAGEIKWATDEDKAEQEKAAREGIDLGGVNLGGLIIVGGVAARETHMPWFCSECAVSRCSAWTPEGGGRCCWCGVWLAMP